MDYETLYNSLFTNSRDAVIFFNKSKITAANKAALDLFESTQTEFIGKDISDFTQDSGEPNERMWKRPGIPWFYTRQINTPSGVKDIEVTSTPVNIPEITSFSIIRDVTERNRTEQKYRAIFERSADLIVISNDEGVQFINPSGLRYLGLSSEDEIIGKSALNLIHPDYKELAVKYAKDRRAGRPAPNIYRTKMLRSDGEVLDTEFNASCILWDGVPSSLTIVRDIRKQIQYDKKLEELHHLAMELVQLKDMESLAQKTILAANEVLGYKRLGFLVLDGDYVKVIATKLGVPTGRISLNGPGIVTRAFRMGESQLVRDVRLDTDYLDITMPHEEETISEYVVPIFVHGKMMAALNLESGEYDAFKDDDIKLITILIDHVTAAMERIAYQRQLEVLHQYSNKLAELKTWEEVAHEALTIIDSLIGAHVSSFGFIENDRIVFKEVLNRATVSEVPLDSRSIMVRAVKTGESQLVNDTRMDPDYVRGPLPEGDVSLSELDIPIKVNDTVVAIINLENSEENSFHEDNQQLLETLARHIESTLKNIEYREKIEQIHETTLKLDKTSNVEEALATTCTSMVESLGYQNVDIIPVEEKSTIDAISTPHQHYTHSVDTPGIVTRAIKTGKTQLVNDTSRDPDYNPGPYIDGNLSKLTVPVYQDEKITYLINVEYSEKNAFTSEDQHLVEMLGVVLGHTLSRLERFKFLEEMMDIRTKELREANKRLKNLSEMKTRFVSTATHELRTPLTVMKGYLELAMDQTGVEDIMQYLAVVQRNTERFESLVNDLLNQQRIEEGRLSLNKTIFDLCEMIFTVVEEMKGLIESRGQTVITDCPGYSLKVHWDESRMVQVMVNLLSNASKYSREGSEIKVEVEEMGQQVQVSVHDQGYGISEEEMERLFTPFPDFYRPIQTERSIGLGLSISKGIVELHGGDIWVESEGRGKGSIFRFRIPVKL